MIGAHARLVATEAGWVEEVVAIAEGRGSRRKGNSRRR